MEDLPVRSPVDVLPELKSEDSRVAAYAAVGGFLLQHPLPQQVAGIQAKGYTGV